MMSGEVWLAFNWKARAYQWAQAGQAPLASALPREGTLPAVFTVGIPAKAPNPDGHRPHQRDARPEAQEQFARSMGYWPTVTSVSPSPELTREIGFTPEEEENIHQSTSPTSRRTTNAGGSSTSSSSSTSSEPG